MAYNGGVIELGDLTPETRPVGLERNGEHVILRAYVDNDRCPVSVRSQVQQAYDRARRSIADDEGGLPSRVLDRDVVLAIVQGIEDEEADALAGNVDKVVNLLKALGWIKDSDEGEVQGEETTSQPTTETSSPDSTSSTESTIG